jgi:HK97 family phage portal protein
MNIFQHAQLVLAYLRGGKTVANVVPSWKENLPTYPPTNFENLVKHGWRKNELIYACINARANTARQVHLQTVNAKGEVLNDHPLTCLLQSPNPYMSESDFWRSILIYQALAGRAIFEKERNNAGKVSRLWAMRPDWVQVIPSGATVIRAYRFTVPGTQPVDIDPKDVLDFKLFDPLNQYHGWPPVAVCARAGDVDNAATDYIKTFWEKGGMPAYYIKTKQRLTSDAAADLQNRWAAKYGGSEHWHKPAVIDADAELGTIGMSFDQMKFDVLDARSEARICMVLGVPPILIGAKVGLDRSTFSNYREARTAWWHDTLIPVYEDLLDTLQNQLLPEFETGLRLQWNYNSVPALQEERSARWARADSAFRAAAITRNEFRAEVGLPELGPVGDVYIQSIAMTEVPAKQTRKRQAEPPPHPREQEAEQKVTLPPRPVRTEEELTAAVERYLSGLGKRIERRLEKDYA